MISKAGRGGGSGRERDIETEKSTMSGQFLLLLFHSINANNASLMNFCVCGKQLLMGHDHESDRHRPCSVESSFLYHHESYIYCSVLNSHDDNYTNGFVEMAIFRFFSALTIFFILEI